MVRIRFLFYFILFSLFAFTFFSTTVFAKDIAEDTVIIDDTATKTTSFDKGSISLSGYVSKEDEINGKEVFTYLKKNYGDSFEKEKNIKGTDVSVKYNLYDSDSFRNVFYGNASTANLIQKNTTVATSSGYTYRFIGVDYTKYSATHNPEVNYDYCTDGTVRARNVVNQPSSNASLLNTDNNILEAKTLAFNTNIGVQDYYYTLKEQSENTKSTTLEYLASSSGKEIRLMWADMLDDKYATPESVKQFSKDSSCYLRYNYSDLYGNHIKIKWPDAMARIEHFHVTMPPTELTDGTAYEWHKQGGTIGGNYDEFYITTKGANFAVTKVTVSNVGMIIAATMKVINTSSYTVDNRATIRSSYSIDYNNINIDLDDVPGTVGVWGAGESKTITLFNDLILNDSLVEKTLEYTGTFNPYKGEDYYETTYTDNSLTVKYKIKDTLIDDDKFEPTCVRSYISASSKVYVDWESRGKYSYCTGQHTKYLNDSIEVGDLKPEYRTLTAAWSSNTKGHNKYKTEINEKDISIQDTVRATGKPKFSARTAISTKVASHKVAGVVKLGRIIRSGRSIEMYSGLSLVITSQSFSSSSTASNNADKMLDYMLGKTNKNKFVVRGNRVEGTTVVGKFENNIGKEESPATVTDGHRSIEYIKAENTSQTYGSCSSITVYQSKKTYFIPLATLNTKEKQKTLNGSYGSSTSYNVSSETNKLYSNVNSPDGVYNMYFRSYIDPTIFEGVQGSEVFCDTRNEKVIIQGNLYDDIRTDTVEVNADDLSW